MNGDDRQQEHGDVSEQQSEQENVSRETTEQENVSRETTEQEQEGEEQQQSFSRDYVERLRSKSANYRLRARESEQEVETLQRALFAERVQRLDIVVAPDEVPYNADLLEDEAALTAAIEQLLESKPYLRKRKAGGDIGQHDQQQQANSFSLLGAMRDNAG